MKTKLSKEIKTSQPAKLTLLEYEQTDLWIEQIDAAHKAFHEQTENGLLSIDVLIDNLERIKKGEVVFNTESAQPKNSLFESSRLQSDVSENKFNYPQLAYNIEKSADPYNVFWTLSIISTSLSELDGSEEGILAEYNYFDEEDAKNDVELLNEATPWCIFQEL